MGCYECFGVRRGENKEENTFSYKCQVHIESETCPGFLLIIPEGENETKNFYLVTINSLEEEKLDKLLFYPGKISIIFDDGNTINIDLTSSERRIKVFELDIFKLLVINIIPKDNIEEIRFLYSYGEQNKESLIDKEITIGENTNLQSKIESESYDSFSFKVKNKEIKMIKLGDPIFIKDNQKVIGIIKAIENKGNYFECKASFSWLINYKEPKRFYQLKNLEDGGFYIGNISKDGVPNIRGHYTFKNGEDYRGEIISDYFEGKGMYIYKDDKYYIGKFKQNLRHGNGTLYYPSGKILYRGNFVNDKFEREGQYFWEKGEYYIGSFKNGLIHGKGKLHYKNGTIKYEGNFVNDKFEGEGKYIYENEYYYIGQFKNGLKEGKGILYYSDGRIEYEGDFKEGKFHGQGKYYYENGDYYIGEFKNGDCDGKGIEYNKKGEVLLEGNWKNGEYIDN